VGAGSTTRAAAVDGKVVLGVILGRARGETPMISQGKADGGRRCSEPEPGSLGWGTVDALSSHEARQGFGGGGRDPGACARGTAAQRPYDRNLSPSLSCVVHHQGDAEPVMECKSRRGHDLCYARRGVTFRPGSVWLRTCTCVTPRTGKAPALPSGSWRIGGQGSTSEPRLSPSEPR
jgi:hypothetical protein